MKMTKGLTVVCIVSAALLACDSNPVSDDRESVDRLYVNPAFITLTVNAEKKITGYPVNKYGEATFDNITVTACDTKVSIREDSTRLPVEPPTRVIARGASAGSSCVVFSSSGLVDTVKVVVN
jgi:hypothetical protein